MNTRTLDRFRSRRPTPAERAVYTVREVAHLLDLSLGGTYTLVREGTIPAIKIGGRWLIPKKRFHAWLDGLNPDDATEDDGASVDVSATNLSYVHVRPRGSGH